MGIAQLGEFELLKRLGAGAQAEVFLAAAADGHLIALKVMLEHLVVNDEARKTFLREARTSSLLKHPNLVDVYEVGEALGRPFLVMELVRGWSVSQLLKKLRASGESRLDQDEAAEIVRQAALGLHFAHELKGPGNAPLGLVHRDVSPQNIMMSELGVAKVVDFGLAKATLVQQDTVTAAIKGKLRYMPPEQLKSLSLDRRADVFGLGAVLWELTCGAPLYPGPSEAEIFQQALYNPQPHPDQVARGLSRQLVDVLTRSTERALEKRMPTAAALAEALAALSSPVAREKLTARAAKLFDPLPRTLDEARELSPIVGAPTPAPMPRARARPRSVVLPAPAKGPSYVEPLPPTAAAQGPTPSPQEFPDRNTDAVTGVDREPKTDSFVGPLVEGDTAANTLPPQSGVSSLTVVDDDDLEPTGSLISAPSRRTIAIVIAASVGVVIIGATIGLALRVSGDEPDGLVGVGENPAASDDEVAAPDDAPTPAPTRHLGRQGRVDIEANVPAVVRERNVELGTTPFSRAFSVGRHHLSVGSTDGTMTYELEVVVTAGGVVKRTVRLASHQAP